MHRLMGPARMVIAEHKTHHHTNKPISGSLIQLLGSRHVMACIDRTKQRLNKARTKGPIVMKTAVSPSPTLAALNFRTFEPALARHSCSQIYEQDTHGPSNGTEYGD